MRFLRILILFLLSTAAACGSVTPTPAIPTIPSDAPLPNQIQIEISGAVTQAPIAFTGGYTPTATNGGYLISGSFETDDGRDIFLYLTVPNGMGAGSFGIKSWEQAVSADGSAYSDIGGSLVVTGNGPATKYEQVSEGTLVLSTVTPFTGTFEFTSTQASGGDAITVKGSFEQLHLPSTPNPGG